MYRGGWMADCNISVGESSDEWLMMRSAMGTMEVMNREWKYWGVGSVVGVFDVD